MEAESYISKMLDRQTPYEVNMFGCTFKISNANIYPPGKLSAMFADYLIDNSIIRNKTVADVGAGCFTLGIIAAKYGAKSVVGVDIVEEAVECARANIKYNDVDTNTIIFKSCGLDALLPEYKGRIDVLLSGVPWDTLSSTTFNSFSDERKALSRAFYDVDNELIADILLRGSLLLSHTGQIFITASKRTIPRIEWLCSTYKMYHQIVRQKDIHQDGNIHYILGVSS